MRRLRLLAVSTLVIAFSALCLTSIASAQAAYTITDLGTLPGDAYSSGVALNNIGQVTGTTNPSGGNIGIRAFLYSGGAMTDLGVLDPAYILAYSNGRGINASGQVTGFSSFPDLIDPPPASFQHAFLYSGGTMRDLGTLGGTFSEGNGINNLGEVTGDSTSTGSSFAHAFLYSGSAMRDLGTLGGNTSVGNAINDFGEVTGISSTAAGPDHAFLYSAGSMRDLGTLGGARSRGNSLNNAGQVAGNSETTNGNTHAFLYSGGVMMDLGTVGGKNSSALSINKLGQVLGSSEKADGTVTYFLYTPGVGMIDLTPFIPTGLGWTSLSLAALNDVGQIVGTGLNASFNFHALLLTPPRPKLKPKLPRHVFHAQ